VAVQRGDLEQVLEAELVQRLGADRALGVVDLVRDVEHGQLGAAQHRHRLAVGLERVERAVEHADHDVRFVERDAHLPGDALAQRIVALGIEAARVDQHVLAAERIRVRVKPIARHAGDVLDDRDARAGQAIEQRALADVGATDDRHQRTTATRGAGSLPGVRLVLLGGHERLNRAPPKARSAARSARARAGCSRSNPRRP
jgi:hypothetical protein